MRLWIYFACVEAITKLNKVRVCLMNLHDELDDRSSSEESSDEFGSDRDDY